MALPLWSWQSTMLAVLVLTSRFSQLVRALTSSDYDLDTEFLGTTFFEGWNFFTDADPTLGFVSYSSELAAQQAGLVFNPSDTQPVYIGVDHDSTIPANGGGRPSVRITTKKSWTHGLFIGDFKHIPAGACGTWPAFWTLGPDWPYTGEIDILEGVNDIETNGISLHTNQSCVITGNTGFQSGVQGGTDCAIYPDQDVGCGVVDRNTDSYSNFNNVGGGAYAMEWTSDYIRVWFWARNAIPQDVIAKEPNPSGWGKPVANMQSPTCLIDKHFQQHNIVIDTTFCGTYAGSIWPGSTCQTKTGYTDCNSYVAANPQAFTDSYWSINSVRVYQLAPPTILNTTTSSMTAQGSTFVETIPMPETYTAPSATLTATSDGLVRTITTKGQASPTHPVFNTTSVDPSAIGPPMGTYTDALSSTHPGESTTATSTGSAGKPTQAFSMFAALPSDNSPHTIPSATTSSQELPGPSVLADFRYAGCKGIRPDSTGLFLAGTSADMTIEQCIEICHGEVFAGSFEQYCFCGDKASNASLVDYPLGYCDIPCPGDHDQLCGGIILPGENPTGSVVTALMTRKAKRQAGYPTGSIILFTLYNKVLLLINNTTTTTTMTSIITQTATSTISRPLPDQSSDLGHAVSSGLGSVSYNITGTNTITSYAISTAWQDYCATCPDYRTTLSTTITVLHCGCTLQANRLGLTTPVTPPNIPMMTTIRSCACGLNGAASSTTVTIPCTSGIASLTSSLAASNTIAPGVFASDTASDAFMQTQLVPASNPDLAPCPDTVTYTRTLQSIKTPLPIPLPLLATQIPTAALPIEHKILGPVIPIPVRPSGSGSYTPLRNKTDTILYTLPILSRPDSLSPTSFYTSTTTIRAIDATSSSPAEMTTTGSSAVITMARSAATKTLDGCMERILDMPCFWLIYLLLVLR